MSEVADLLRSEALELGNQASVDDWQMIKSAAVTALVDNGHDSDKASELIDGLASEINPNLDRDMEKAAQLARVSDILEKAANYIVELEVKLDSKEADIEGLNKAAQEVVIAPSVEALSGTGAFTTEDLESLSQLDQGTLEKVAGLTDNVPMSLGGPSEQPSTVSDDPMLKFLLS